MEFQLLTSVFTERGKPASCRYALVEFTTTRLQQMLDRVEHLEDMQEGDTDLLESSYYCDHVKFFTPTSQKLQKKVERLLGNANHIILFRDNLKIPASALAPVATTYCLTSQGEVSWKADVPSGSSVYTDVVPVQFFDVALTLAAQNSPAETSPEPAPAPAPPPSYFS